jgi:protein CMS1
LSVFSLLDIAMIEEIPSTANRALIDREQQAPLLSSSAKQVVESKRKRKREKEKTNKKSSQSKAPTSAPKSTKRPKPDPDVVSAKDTERKFKVKQQRKQKLQQPARPEKFNADIAQMSPVLVADYFGQRLRRIDKNASIVELNDSYVPSMAVTRRAYFLFFLVLKRKTCEWLDRSSICRYDTVHPPASPRASYRFSRAVSVDHLMQSRVEFLLENPTVADENKPSVAGLNETHISTASTTTGSPHTLIITAAALRAADVSRAVRGLQGNGYVVAKLFAKHIKLQQSIELCNSLKMGIGVGTPRRILDLIKDGMRRLMQVHLQCLNAEGKPLADRNNPNRCAQNRQSQHDRGRSECGEREKTGDTRHSRDCKERV